MTNLRKFGATLVILFSLFNFAKSNLPFAVAVPGRSPVPVAGLSFFYDEILSPVLFHVGRAGWIIGIDTRWRMFSPPDKRNWRFRYDIVDANGAVIPYVLPVREARTFWQRNFIDFRDVKFELNIYGSKPAQQLFAQHLCDKFRQRGSSPVEVRMFLEWRPIAGPDGTLLDQGDPQTNRADFWNATRCFPSLKPKAGA